MQIETISIDELTPYARNVNVHDDEQVEQIAESIKEFGFRDPVGVWENDVGGLEIVEGHGRVMAARSLGMTEIPVIRLDDMTDKQRRAYSILHNQLTRNSEFDLDLLADEVKSLGDDDFEFSWEDFGLDQVDLEFEDFDGEGGGDKTIYIQGGKVRVIIGACLVDIDDPTHELYDKTRTLEPEDVKAYIGAALRNDAMVR